MKDAYQQITDTMIALVDDAGQWSPPWRSTGTSRPVNASTKKHYRGINVFMCWASAMRNGYSSNRWATFNQWKDMDCSVKKGERGTAIIFFKDYERSNDKGEDEKIIVSRVSYVFNAAQVTGERANEPEPRQSGGEVVRNNAIDNFVFRLNPKLQIGGDRACYIPSVDTIQMPKLEQFKQIDHYYSVLFHELVHWSGAKHRLDRDLSNGFGSSAYAAEEMIAEMGAAFLAADFSIENHVRDDHARYLKSWLAAAKEDKRALVRAAAKASKAVEFLHELNYIELESEVA